jgi:hypothetical protein
VEAAAVLVWVVALPALVEEHQQLLIKVAAAMGRPMVELRLNLEQLTLAVVGVALEQPVHRFLRLHLARGALV